MGLFDSALGFDGNGALAIVPDDPTLDLTNGMTLMAWVRPDPISFGWQHVLSKQRSDVIAYYLAANTQYDAPCSGFNIDGSWISIGDDQQLPAMEWSHIAATYDGAKLRLFVDGVRVATRSIGKSIETSSDPLMLGGNNLGEYFQGKLDEVRIYNRKLLATEINDVMFTPLVDDPVPTPTPIADLVASYGCNEGSGSVLNDKSGNANNGVLQGATWQDGLFGSGLGFDGASALVVIPDKSSLDLTDGMTLMAWVRPDTTLDGWQHIISKQRSSVIAYYLAANSQYNAPWSGFYVGDMWKSTGDDQALPAGEWSHLASTYDGATLRLYVEGILVATRDIGLPIQTSNDPLMLGGNHLDEYFQGTLDEVRIYNRALSAAEIDALIDVPID